MHCCGFDVTAVGQMFTQAWDLAIGAAAGVASVLVSMPMDVIKTYMQTHGAGAAVAPGLGGQVAAFWQTGGWEDGFGRWLTALPSTCWAQVLPNVHRDLPGNREAAWDGWCQCWHTFQLGLVVVGGFGATAGDGVGIGE